jgi:hypothetical protein
VEIMLAKMPQKTVKSSFRNKLTIISLVLLMGLGLSAAYFTVPFLQSPIPTTNNLIGNTTNNTVAAPVSHTNASAIGIETPQVNTTSTNTNKSTGNTPSASTSKQVNNTSNQGTNKQGSNTSKTTTNKIKTSTNSQTSQSSTKKQLTILDNWIDKFFH